GHGRRRRAARGAEPRRGAGGAAAGSGRDPRLPRPGHGPAQRRRHLTFGRGLRAAAVVVPEHHAPPVTSALAKAASGALEAVPRVRVTTLARALDQAKAAGFWTVGLAEDAADLLSDLDLPARAALVLGGEGAGLRRLTRERSDFLARLPTSGTIAS